VSGAVVLQAIATEVNCEPRNSVAWRAVALGGISELKVMQCAGAQGVIISFLPGYVIASRELFGARFFHI
jgi:hypothetical protein